MSLHDLNLLFYNGIINSLIMISFLFIHRINGEFNAPHFPHSVKTANRFNISNADVWIEFESLAVEYGAVSYGWGAPNYFPPKHLMDALNKMRLSKDYSIHQYARTQGHPRLVKALAAFYSKLMNRRIDPLNEVLVTTGAMQSMRFVFQAYLNPGEEIILFEPFFHPYILLIQLSGGVPVFVPFRYRNGKNAKTSADLTFDPKVFESKITNKTKLILLNNPNNPTGKMFTREELKIIAGIQKKYDLIVIADEVAQFYEMENRPHIRYASLPGTWSRTITVNSGGKTFANTGWRIGWSIAPRELLWAMSVDVFTNVASVATPMQEAFAIGIEIEVERLGTKASYFEVTKKMAIHQRNRFLKIFKKVGIEAVIPEAGYFLMADFSKLRPKMNVASVNETRDGFQMAMWLLKKKKISLMPGILFYDDEHSYLGENMTRICFLRTDEAIDEFGRAVSTI